MRTFSRATAGLAASILLLAPVRADVPTSADAVRPAEVGARAPVVTLRDVDGNPVDLGSLLAEGPAALVFYRGGW